MEGQVSPTNSISSPSENLPEGFKVIDGRTFSTRSAYLLPTDDAEGMRLNLQHCVLRHIMHGNFSAPVEELLQQGIKVLEPGCGTGVWTLEMARDYPKSTFVGIDMAAVFPTTDIPANCSFLQANTLEGLPFEDGTFGYVFQRYMFASFTPTDWQTSIKELARLTKPGGWVESFEASSVLERPPKDSRVKNAIYGLSEARGIDFGYVTEIKGLLAANGFVDLESDYVSIPLGWGGRVGDLQGKNGIMAWSSLAPIVAPILKIDNDDYVDLVTNSFANFKANKTWHKAYYVYGRKPLNM